MKIEDASEKDFENALLHIRDHGKGLDNLLLMVKAQCQMPEHRITATALAAACGWNDYSSANLHYGTFGRQVAQYLDYTPPARKPGDGKPKWWTAISTSDATGAENGQFEFILRPALAAALTNMNWLR